jgi:hypothetical protein
VRLPVRAVGSLVGGADQRPPSHDAGALRKRLLRRLLRLAGAVRFAFGNPPSAQNPAGLRRPAPCLRRARAGGVLHLTKPSTEPTAVTGGLQQLLMALRSIRSRSPHAPSSVPRCTLLPAIRRGCPMAVNCQGTAKAVGWRRKDRCTSSRVPSEERGSVTFRPQPGIIEESSSAISPRRLKGSRRGFHFWAQADLITGGADEASSHYSCLDCGQP